ncbi:hypothetical protein CPB97_003843, partial [Podila verticillata]
MVQSGMMISVIMCKLTIEHAALTHLLQSGGKQQLSRDDFITYDDVYNIYYALQDTNLYTVVVKNRETEFGIPVAFFLTKVKKDYVIEGFLRVLKARMDEDCQKAYCPAAWERKLKTDAVLGMQGLPIEEKKERRDKIRKQLRAMMYSRCSETTDAMVEAFTTEWTPIAPNLMKYMNDQYLGHPAIRRRWMFCHRRNVAYGWIDTNNLIESWHNTMKTHFFKDKIPRRLDHVIYILINNAVPHYQTRCNLYFMEVGRKTKGALHKKAVINTARAYMKARQDRHLDAALLIPPGDGESYWNVTSYTTEGVFYELETEGGTGVNGKFVSCSCLAFAQSSRFCKYIALGMLILPGIDFQAAESWRAKDESLVPMSVPYNEGGATVDMGIEQEAEELLDSKPISSFDLVNHYIDSLVALRDQMKPDFAHEAEVVSGLKRAFDLCNEHFSLKT